MSMEINQAERIIEVLRAITGVLLMIAGLMMGLVVAAFLHLRG